MKFNVMQKCVLGKLEENQVCQNLERIFKKKKKEKKGRLFKKEKLKELESDKKYLK